MMLTSTAVDLTNISIPNAALIALTGYAVVFFGLILLMLVVIAMGKIFIARDRKLAEKSASEKAELSAIPVVTHPKGSVETFTHSNSAAAQAAPGSAGQLKLYDVEPKTAAMIMAIVANKMGKPLNELRFISIKEVK